MTLSENGKKAIIFQTIQSLFLILFIGFIYQKENWFYNYAHNHVNSWSLGTMTSILKNNQLGIIPFKVWLIAWPLFLVSFSLIILKKLRWFFLSLSGFLTFIYITADKLSLEYFSVITTVSSLKALPQLWDIRSSIASVLPLSIIFDITIISLFILFGFFFNRKIELGLDKNPLMFFSDKLLGGLAFLFALYSFNLAFFVERHEILLEQTSAGELSFKIYNDKKEVQRNEKNPELMLPYKSSVLDYAVSFGVINFHIKDLISSTLSEWKRDDFKINEKDLAYINEWFKHRKKLNELESPFYSMAKGRNFIVITMESIHPRVIGTTIDSEEITPNLNSLVKDGLSWEYCLAQGFSGGTSDSEFSLMTGLLPEVNMISAFELPQRIKFSGLPDVLRKNGYRTMSFHGNEPNFWNRQINHPIYGIDKMYFEDSFKGLKKIGMGTADEEFFVKSAQYMALEKQPFFSYLITLSAHNPYKTIPDGYDKIFKNAKGDEMAINYLRLMKYADYSLGKFIEELKNKGLWDNSVLIIMGDHIPPMTAEAKDTFGKLMKVNMSAFREDRIPLIISIPGKEDIIRKYGDIYNKTVVGINDVFPTILHLAGLTPPGSISGLNLFLKPEAREPLVVSGFNNRFWAWKSVVYDGQDNIVGDKNGVVFEGSNSIIDDKELRKSNYQKTLTERAIYKLIYSSGHGIGMD